VNVITPNGDGINDSWTISELFTNCNDFQMEILNRWGNVVYSFTQDNPFFSGKDISGNDLIEGVYFYRFTSNEKLLHGNITLIR
jgi:gliding motility-associated-like protein